MNVIFRKLIFQIKLNHKNKMHKTVQQHLVLLFFIYSIFNTHYNQIQFKKYTKHMSWLESRYVTSDSIDSNKNEQEINCLLKGTLYSFKTCLFIVQHDKTSPWKGPFNLKKRHKFISFSSARPYKWETRTYVILSISMAMNTTNKNKYQSSSSNLRRST